MIDFIKWFLVGYLFIGFWFGCLGLIAVTTDRKATFEIRKDGDPWKVPFAISLIVMFAIVWTLWPVLIAKTQLRRRD